MPIIVFDLADEGNLLRLVEGDTDRRHARVMTQSLARYCRYN